MARKVNLFIDVQILIARCLFFILIDIVSANEIVTSRFAIVGKTVDLHCSFPVSNQTVKWEQKGIAGNVPLSTCEVSCQTEDVSTDPQATRNETSSIYSFIRHDEGERQIYCLLGKNIQQIYNVTIISEPDIFPPNCSIIPTTSHHGKDATLIFSCESSVPSEIPYRLNIHGLSENISTSGKSELHVENDVDVEIFIENLNVVCELIITDLDISNNCSFPHSTNVTYTPDVTNMVTDAVFDCHADRDDAVTWRLLDSEGQEEDMAGRSWTRDGKRSLLIKNITKQDLGKVAECRSNDSVGFGVIDDIGSSGNELDYSGGTGTNVGHRDRLVYVTLTYVFGGALLITLLIAISHWRCGVCAHPMKWYAQFKPNSKPKTSPMNQLACSTGPNVSGGGSNSRSPGRDVLTTESNLNSGNQNNSALNHPRDPTPQMKATSSSDADASSSGHPDQPVVDTNQHTYFCVERTTPPPSLPDLSTSGSVTIYQDPDYEESHGERLRDSAGYDVVDASKKVNNNFNLDDYAEVGGAYDMTSNPAIAPHSSKGWIGKGIVMSSDPAVLYGKVNK